MTNLQRYTFKTTNSQNGLIELTPMQIFSTDLMPRRKMQSTYNEAVELLIYPTE